MGASTFAIQYAERKLSMAEPRAKRLDTARADGQDRCHEARQAAGVRARRKTGLKAAINPRAAVIQKPIADFGVLLDV